MKDMVAVDDCRDETVADAREVLASLALSGKFRVGDIVRTNTMAAATAEATLETNRGGYPLGYFRTTRQSPGEIWHGTITEIDFRRPDCLLVGHGTDANPPFFFIAWYRPEDVTVEEHL